MGTETALVLAVATNGVIGKDNKLVWKLKADMKFFREITTNNVVVMGRKTFDSIKKPLANRINIVISRNKELTIEGCIVVHSLEKALEIGNSFHKNVYIIGGAQIYKSSLPFAEKIYLTRVIATPEGDAYFDLQLIDGFKKVNSVFIKQDENNEHDFYIEEFVKI